MKRIPLFFVGLLFTTSCGFFKMPGTTESMKKTTEELNQKTGRMNETTDDLKDLTAAMKEITSNVYDDSRQAFTAKTKIEFWGQLIQSQSQAGKVAAAAGFMKSMQFQLIREEEINDEHLIDEMYEESVSEFFRKLQDFVVDRVGLNPDFPIAMQKVDKYTPELRSVQALAASLHLKNRKQIELERHLNGNFKAVSLLDLIKQALLKRNDDPTTLKLWEREVLYYEKLAVFILNVRMNFVQLLAMATLHYDQPFTGMLGGLTEWYAKFEALNNVEILKVNDQLKDALGVRTFLQSGGMGWPVIQNSDFLKKWKLMKEIDSPSTPKSARDRLIGDTKTLIGSVAQ